MGFMFVSVMVIAWRFPISFKAEDRFRAQLRRYLFGVAGAKDIIAFLRVWANKITHILHQPQHAHV